MKERTVKIVNTLGLHARPAAAFAKLASDFESQITVVKDGNEVNGKSILGLMMLVAPKGSEITIRAEGPDEEEAVEALVKLVEHGFGED